MDMTGACYGQGRSQTPIALSGFLIVAAMALGSCGGTVTESPVPSSPTATATGGASPIAPASALVVTRTGGLAGFHDTVEIAADGTARVTRKTGEAGACTPRPEALDRLRAIDLAAVGPAGSKSQMADAFTYEVRSESRSASASEGDEDPSRVELVRAAADVVSSCLASQSETDAPDM